MPWLGKITEEQLAAKSVMPQGALGLGHLLSPGATQIEAMKRLFRREWPNKELNAKNLNAFRRFLVKRNVRISLRNTKYVTPNVSKRLRANMDFEKIAKVIAGARPSAANNIGENLSPRHMRGLSVGSLRLLGECSVEAITRYNPLKTEILEEFLKNSHPGLVNAILSRKVPESLMLELNKLPARAAAKNLRDVLTGRTLPVRGRA